MDISSLCFSKGQAGMSPLLSSRMKPWLPVTGHFVTRWMSQTVQSHRQRGGRAEIKAQIFFTPSKCCFNE